MKREPAIRERSEQLLSKSQGCDFVIRLGNAALCRMEKTMTTDKGEHGGTNALFSRGTTRRSRDDEIECPTCLGRGYVVGHTYIPEAVETRFKCDECEGRGVLDTTKKNCTKGQDAP